jgi:hypothetical protein
MAPASPTRWPDEFRPDRAPVYSFNEIDVAAPPARVCAWLVRAADWPSYYANASNVRFVDRGGPDLALGSTITWRTFGVTVRTTVVEFEPHERLAWRGFLAGGAGYHAWVITPSGTGSHVVTEETQRGIVPSLGRLFLRGGLHTWHQRWLEGLKRVAEAGAPG